MKVVLRDNEHPLTLIDRGEDYASGPDPKNYRYFILNGYHRMEACKRLGIEEFMSNVYSPALSPKARVVLSLNYADTTLESSLGHVMATFVNTGVVALKEASSIFGQLLGKTQAGTPNWANKFVLVAKTPDIYGPGYEYYQTDNREFKGQGSKALFFERLKYGILNKMKKNQGVLAEILFVKLPKICDPNSFLEVLLYITDVLYQTVELNKTVFKNNHDCFTIGQAAYAMCRLIPFFRQALLDAGFKDAIFQQNLGDFVFYISKKCNLKTVENDAFFERFNYTLEQIPIKVLAPIVTKSEKSLELTDSTVSSAVASLLRLVPKPVVLSDVPEFVEATTDKYYKRGSVRFRFRYYQTDNRYHLKCFFQFAATTQKRFHLVFADIPYMCTEYDFDQPSFVGSTLREGGFGSVSEYLNAITKSVWSVLETDSFALLFCGFAHQHELIENFELLGATKVVPMYFPKEPSVEQRRRGATTMPLNAMEVGLLVKKGQPSWVKYGIIILITGGDTSFIVNVMEAEWPAGNRGHPFEKPPQLYHEIMTIYSNPNHEVLEAFAGTCPSLYSGFRRGRNITFVEKNPAFEKYFSQGWDDLITFLRQRNEKKEKGLKFFEEEKGVTYVLSGEESEEKEKGKKGKKEKKEKKEKKGLKRKAKLSEDVVVESPKKSKKVTARLDVQMQPEFDIVGEPSGVHEEATEPISPELEAGPASPVPTTPREVTPEKVSSPEAGESMPAVEEQSPERPPTTPQEREATAEPETPAKRKADPEPESPEKEETSPPPATQPQAAKPPLKPTGKQSLADMAKRSKRNK